MTNILQDCQVVKALCQVFENCKSVSRWTQRALELTLFQICLNTHILVDFFLLSPPASYDLQLLIFWMVEVDPKFFAIGLQDWWKTLVSGHQGESVSQRL